MVKKRNKVKVSLARRLLAWAIGIVGGLLFIAAVVWIAFQVSPWPSALLIRSAFDDGARKRVAALQKHVPQGVDSIMNQQYKSGDKDAYLDVFYPAGTKQGDVLPTVVWVHGGGWVSGDKSNVADYLKIIASKGYTAIGVDYSIAPEKHYPTPVIQVSEALAYIDGRATDLHVDKDRLVMAGDSAGSQIAAQVATIITNDDYAKLVGIDPPIAASQLKGMMLSCGAYDLSIVHADDKSEGAELLRTFLWAYSGHKDFMKDPQLAQASVIDYVNSDFPPTFLTAGNDDPLLPQSTVMAQKLDSLKVPVDGLFYPSNYTPALPHEYQFNLDIEAGQMALDRMLAFLGEYAR